MPAADVGLTVIVVAALPLCFWRPWLGVVVFSWLSYMNPHRLMDGFAYTMPFAKMVAGATLLGLIWRRDYAPLPRTRETYLLLALWVTCLLSTAFTAIHPMLARSEFVAVSKIMLMTGVTLVLFQDRYRLRLLLLVMGLSIGFYAVKGGIQAVQTAGYERIWGPPQTAIGDNNAIGFVLTMVVPLLVYLRYDEPRAWLRHTLLATYGLSIITIAATYSRASLLGLGVVLAILLVKLRLRDRPLVLVTIAAAVLIAAAPVQWYQRVQTIPTAYRADPSGLHRLTSWYVAYRLGLDHPLLGAGFWPFAPYVYEQYLPGNDDFHDAHNHFLQIFAEQGFIGLALFVGLILSVCYTLRHTIRMTRGDPARRWIYHSAHGIEISIAAYVFGGAFINLPYFDFFYQLVAVAVLLQQCAVATPIAAASD